MAQELNIAPAGDLALMIEFENEISPETNARVRAADFYLREESGWEGLLEIIPTYRSLLVYFDPGVWDYNRLKEELMALPDLIKKTEVPNPSTLEIPVVYGGEYGPDLEYVAEHNGISTEEVVEIHHSSSYLIYMLGFVPGFPYLGGMSEKIATPRLKSPRVAIPAGSIGIAGAQTGIYPLESPGGWQLIGRTPLKLFDPEKEDPFLPKPGHYLKFFPIEEKDFEKFRA